MTNEALYQQLFLQASRQANLAAGAHRKQMQASAEKFYLSALTILKAAYIICPAKGVRDPHLKLVGDIAHELEIVREDLVEIVQARYGQHEY